ncbi:MAG: glycosyl hydrolase 53 family protein [Ekhidna sp.]|nr:glycosyl hydrolase 53 family protein [Ekhidna sp.]
MKLSNILFLFLLLSSCSSDTEESPDPQDPADERNFLMGFTSWSFGPNVQDVNDTYTFISDHGDIYAEHVDNNIPWNAWINDLELPEAFTNEIRGKAEKKIAGKQFLLSVSLLRSSRDELAFDFDGSIPAYGSLDDQSIKDAYSKHVEYLVRQLTPDYLVIAIEVNELRLNAPEKWEGYKALISDVKARIKNSYPTLKISESISLHNLIEPEVSDVASYTSEMFNHMNQLDFVSISFYPFFKGQSTEPQFQEAFDLLHTNVNPPIAFVETAHLAEDLNIPNLNVFIPGNETSQKVYLETLLKNADNEGYEFIFGGPIVILIPFGRPFQTK